jgi:methanogenic corrinoid protein MtbC1
MHDSFTTMLYQVFVPLMQRLGALWVSNRMSPASEHFATALVKQRLLTMLQATAPAGCVPILLCACPAGERHELGLLTFAYTLQQEGWRICYLGADLPIVELRYACQQLRPALVALSLTYTTGPAQCLEVLQELDTVLASTYPTLVGGQGVAAYVQHLHPEYVRCCSTLDEAQAYARRLRFQRSGAEHGISTLGKVVGYQ